MQFLNHPFQLFRMFQNVKYKFPNEQKTLLSKLYILVDISPTQGRRMRFVFTMLNLFRKAIAEISTTHTLAHETRVSKHTTKTK